MIQTRQIKLETTAWDAAAAKTKSKTDHSELFADLFDNARLQQAQNNTQVDAAKTDTPSDRIQALKSQPEKSKTDAHDHESDHDTDETAVDTVGTVATPQVDQQNDQNESSTDQQTESAEQNNQNEKIANTSDQTTPNESQNQNLDIKVQTDTPAPVDNNAQSALQADQSVNQTIPQNDKSQNEQPPQIKTDIDVTSQTEQAPKDQPKPDAASVKNAQQTNTPDSAPVQAKPEKLDTSDFQKQNQTTQPENPLAKDTDDQAKINLNKEQVAVLDSNSGLDHDQTDAQSNTNQNLPQNVELPKENKQTDQTKTSSETASAEKQNPFLQSIQQNNNDKSETTYQANADTTKAAAPATEKSTKNKTTVVTQIHDATPKIKIQTTQTESAAKSEQPSAVDTQQNVDRVVKAATAAVRGGNARVQIRLDPPDLGTLRIDIRQNAQGIQLQLQATNTRAQQILQQNSNELKAALHAQGVNATQIDVQLRLDLRNDASAQHQQDSSGQQQQHQQNPNQQSFNSMFFREQPNQNAQQQNFESDPETYEWADAVSESDTDGSDNQWQELSFNKVNVTI